MHSGFFYKLSRLKTSPNKIYLNQLVIFKWQSYLTFITGMLYLAVIYYYNAGVLMVDKKVLVLSPLTAIIFSQFYRWLSYLGLFMIFCVNLVLLKIIFYF